MKLKCNVPLADFLKAVNICAGEVFYKTDEADVLNLKSQLSRYLFLAVLSSNKEAAMTAGEIVCDNPEDYRHLQNYLQT